MKTRTSIILATVLVIVGCTTTKLVENPPGSGHYDKVVEVDPKLSAGLEAGKALNDVSAPFNPFHGAVTILLGATTALASWFVKRKQAQLNATIAGVESSGDAGVKAAIKTAAMAAGVESALNKTVKSVTG